MAKNTTLNWGWAAFSAFTIVWGVDWAIVRFSGYPFLYCWTPHIVGEMYILWGSVVLYIACAYTAVSLLRRRIYPALGGALFITAIIELPRLADMAFRMGGSCG
jgi:hypothetical protein